MHGSIGIEAIRQAISEKSSNNFEGALEYFSNVEGQLFQVEPEQLAPTTRCMFAGMIWAAFNEGKQGQVDSIIGRARLFEQELGEDNNVNPVYEEFFRDTIRYAHNVQILEYSGIYSIIDKYIATRASQDPIVHLAVRVMTQFQHDQLYQVTHRFKAIPRTLIDTMCNTSEYKDERLVKILGQFTSDPVRLNGELVCFDHDYDTDATIPKKPNGTAPVVPSYRDRLEKLVQVAVHLEQRPLPV